MDKPMKIAFISPRGSESNQQNNILNSLYQKLMKILTFIEIEDIEFMPNLGLITLAGFLDGRWEIRYIEEDYVTPQQMQPLLLDESYDLVCLGGVNSQAYRAYQIADSFRSRGIYTVMGGLHASMLPGEAAEHVDTVIVGEGEDTFPLFIQDFLRGEPKPMYQSTGRYDLKEAPMPRFDVIENITRFNKITLQATRGCPHHCEYCCLHEVYGPRYRKKSPLQVVREIEKVKSLYPRPFISFADENLLVDRRYSRELLGAVAQCGVRWEGYCDISVAEDDGLLELLPRSNCVLLMIGLETLDRRNLQDVAPGKARFMEDYENAVNRIQSHGVGVMGLFMLGFDHDTEDTFYQIRDFIKRTRMFDVDFAIVCPIPGTRLYKRWLAEGRITCRDWDKYAWYNVNYEPKNLTSKQLKEGIMWLFREFNSPEEIARKKEHFQRIYRRLYSDEKTRREKLEQLGMLQYC
jgi:radical SAM superfamily enzyme YgiQ (UPF0313 family)